MAEPEICKVCELVSRRDMGLAPLWDSIYRTQFWDIVHCNDTSLLGWIVIVARRHIEAISQLTQEEALDLGIYLRKVSIALNEVVHCHKTYVIQFAESEGHRHVHFHVIPRMADLSEENRSVNIFNYLGVSDRERVSEESMNNLSAEVRQILEMEQS